MLNAWYACPELLDQLGARYDEPIELPDGTTRKIDAFEMYRPRISAHENARVTVVGHFPNVAKNGEYAKLTVLERNCTSPLLASTAANCSHNDNRGSTTKGQ